MGMITANLLLFSWILQLRQGQGSVRLEVIAQLPLFDSMTCFHTIHIHDRQKDRHYQVQVPEDRYILQSAENQGADLPFACRNGACTTCAVRVTSGQVEQPEAMGLSPDLRDRGYALLCVSYPRSDLAVETQDEDEVYEQQFGRYFGKGKVRFGLPLEED
jgi:ferredoxin